jgi:hypothetical protein
LDYGSRPLQFSPLTASTDVFNIASDGDGNTVITQNGTTVVDEPTEDILSLSITGGAAEVAINFTNGDPLPASGIYTDASNVELDGPHGTDPLVTTATAAYLGSDEIRYLPGTTLTDNLSSDGGVFAIAGTTNLSDPAGDAVTVATGATVLFNGSQTFSSLTIQAGGTVRQISQDTTLGDTVLTIGSLSISDPEGNGNKGGVLDLGYGDLILQPGITPDTEGSETSLGQIQQWLAAGYDGGAWDGLSASGTDPASIISSGAASDPYQIESLGYAEVGTDTSDGDLDIGTFDGQVVDSGNIVIGLTYYGDGNLDRQVNSIDNGMIGSVSNSSSGATGWTNGDFNYSGTVDPVLSDSTIDNTTTIILVLGATQPTNPPTFSPTGNYSGGTTVGTSTQVDTPKCKGTITITTGGTATGIGKTYNDSIGITFNRSDGASAFGHCYWLEVTTRTGTLADGTTANTTGTYPASPWDKAGKTRLTLTRTFGQTYGDVAQIGGYSSALRPDPKTVISVDSPNDTNLPALGGKATTTWTVHDYLICDGAVIYEVTWTMTETAATYPQKTYAVTSQGAASQVDGNPKQWPAGVDAKGNTVYTVNPAYVPPAK